MANPINLFNSNPSSEKSTERPTVDSLSPPEQNTTPPDTTSPATSTSQRATWWDTFASVANATKQIVTRTTPSPVSGRSRASPSSPTSVSSSILTEGAPAHDGSSSSAPQGSFLSRAWSSVTGTVQTPISGTGRALGDGFTAAAKEGIDAILTSGQTAKKARETLQKIFFSSPSQNMSELNTELNVALHSPDKLTFAQITRINTYLAQLTEKDSELDKLGLDSNEKTTIYHIAMTFAKFVTQGSSSNEELLATFRKDLASQTNKHFLSESIRIVKKLSMLQPEPGIFDTFKNELMGPKGITAQLKEDLTGQSPSQLSSLRQLFGQFKAAWKKHEKSNIDTYTDQIDTLLRTILRDKQTIFSKKPLSSENETRLQRLQQDFQSMHEDDHTLTDDDHLHRMEGLVNQLCYEYDSLAARAGAQFYENGIAPALDRLEENLSKQLPPELPLLRQLIREFKAVWRRSDKRQIQNYADRIDKHLLWIFKKEHSIFSKPLSEEEKPRLKLLQTTFYKVATSDPTFILIESDFDLIEPFIDRLCHKYGTDVSRAGDQLYQSFGAPLAGDLNSTADRMEGWGRQAQQFLGISSSSTESTGHEESTAVRATTSTSTSSAQILAGEWFSSIGKMVASMFAKGLSSLSKGAASSLFSNLASGLAQILEQTKDNPRLEEHHKALKELSAQVESWIENPLDFWSSLTYLRKNIAHLASIFNSLHIYVNGALLPSIPFVASYTQEEEPLSDGDYFENIDILRHASPQSEETQDWQALASAEKDKFIENTTQLVTAEYILGPASKDVCLRLIQTAKESDTSLKTLILNELKQKNISWLHYFFAWLVYSISHSLIQGFVQRASNAYFEEVFEYIQKQKQQRFEGFNEMMLTNSTRYLTILNDAFSAIPQVKPAHGLIEEMLKKQMDLPERNLFQTPEQIYREFAQNVIRKGLGGRGPVNGICAWIFNKLIGNQEAAVKYIIDSSVAALRDVNGYAPALNSIILDLLKDVEKKLKSPQPHAEENPFEHFSAHRKEQLVTLVQLLFDVLQKSKCNIKELEDLSNGEKPQENLIKRILATLLGTERVDEYVVHEVMQGATLILANAIEQLAQEDQLQKLTYNFLRTANNVYQVNAPLPSPAEEDEKERQIKTLAERILKNTILRAVDERANAYQKEQQEVDQSIAHLRQETTAWTSQTAQLLQELRTLDPTTLDAQIKSKTLRENALAFCSQMAKKISHIETNNWQQKNKEQVVNRYNTIAQHSKALSEQIIAIHLGMLSMENYDKLLPHLQDILQRMQKIEEFIENPTSTSIAACLEQVASIQTQQKTIESLSIPGLEKATTNLANALVQMQKAAQAIDFLDDLIDQHSPLLNQIFNATNSSSLKPLILSFEQEIQKAIPEEDRRPFMDSLASLATAKSHGSNVEAEKHKLFTLAAEKRAHFNQSLAQRAQTSLADRQMIQKNIRANSLWQPGYLNTQKQVIIEAREKAISLLDQFAKSYPQKIKDIPFLNWDLIDTSSLKGPAAKEIYETSRERTDELLRLAKSKGTAYSFINHMVLIPHNQHERDARSMFVKA